ISTKLQRFEEAIIYFDIAIKMKNDYSEAYFGKGIALVLMLKYDEAEACYDKVIELTPKDSQIYSNKALLLLKKKMYNEALELCDKSIRVKYNTKLGIAFAYFTKSRVYAMMNKKKECIANLSKAIRLNPVINQKVHECKEFDCIRNDEDFINTIS
ncbi:tetratricopeptide repeat protein, partial [Clostridium sp.]|uniref:tetratricopeptide repeat protein n=1 Tax=Clostridium sp. TaxID=1506 RepID=UPI001A420811